MSLPQINFIQNDKCFNSHDQSQMGSPSSYIFSFLSPKSTHRDIHLITHLQQFETFSRCNFGMHHKCRKFLTAIKKRMSSYCEDINKWEMKIFIERILQTENLSSITVKGIKWFVNDQIDELCTKNIRHIQTFISVSYELMLIYCARKYTAKNTYRLYA